MNIYPRKKIIIPTIGTRNDVQQPVLDTLVDHDRSWTLSPGEFTGANMNHTNRNLNLRFILAITGFVPSESNSEFITSD